MLILSIAMFSVGILIFKNLVSNLIITKDKLQGEIMDEINHKLALEGIAISSKHIETGGYDQYYIGIRNDLDYTDTFYVFVECDFAEFKNGTIICDDDSSMSCDAYDSWIAFNPIGPVHIKKFESAIPVIDVTVPKNAAKGTYEFDARVCTDNPCTDQYLISKRFSVIAG